MLVDRGRLLGNRGLRHELHAARPYPAADLDAGFHGLIAPPGPELERRLIELGFVEGADVELLHQGLFGGDPIAVRVADTTIALRRREAMAILVTAAGS